MTNCAADGDTDCRVMTTYRHQYVASTYAGTGLDNRTFTGPTIEVARDVATKGLKQRAPDGECRIVHADCSEPLFNSLKGVLYCHRSTNAVIRSGHYLRVYEVHMSRQSAFARDLMNPYEVKTVSTKPMRQPALSALALICGTALLWLAVGSAPASAEGRCPPGSYPVGGQGVGGCAPTGAGAGGSSGSSVPRATGRWHKTWGSVASSDSTGDAGASVGRPNKSEAEQQAVLQCQRGGASDCRTLMTYKNQCVAVAGPPRGMRGGGAGRAGTIEDASRRAMAECTKNGDGAPCSIKYSDCSKPVYEYY